MGVIAEGERWWERDTRLVDGEERKKSLVIWGEGHGCDLDCGWALVSSKMTSRTRDSLDRGRGMAKAGFLKLCVTIVNS